MKGCFRKGKSDNILYLIIFGDTDVLRKLQIFGKALELKLKKIQAVLYSMIKITWK